MTPLGEDGGVCVITLCLPSSWWRSRPRRCSGGASGSSPKLVSRVAMALAKCLQWNARAWRIPEMRGCWSRACIRNKDGF